MSDLAQLGPYRIVRPVGRGGMGVVYEAIHGGLNKRVALKVLPESMAGPGRLERFLREARLAAGLHHTHIVPVFDAGVADGLPYYAMQFIDGRPLSAGKSIGTSPPAADVVTGTLAALDVFESDAPTGLVAAPPVAPPGRQFPAADVARFGAQAADGLAYAHARGVVHRDIKPANLLVDAAGVLWIADFGLAFHTEEETLTIDGAILGTPQYMSPEQARSDKEIDARTDVYSLGVTLYELATGRRAFPGTGLIELLRQVQEDMPPPIRTVSAEVPRDLEVVIEKAMAKRPADRYPTAAAMEDDLQRFLAGRPILARRISSVSRAWRWAKRNPSVASLLTAVLVVFTAGALLSGYYARMAGQKAADAEGHAAAARLREAEALVASARGTRLSRRPGQRFEALAALKRAAEIGRELGRPPEWFDPLRSEAINALALPDLHITHTFGRWEADTNRVDLSADFELYAQTNRTGECVVRRVADDAEVLRVPGLTGPVWPQFGPGRWLALWEEETSTGQVWDLSGSEPVRRLGPTAGVSHSFRSDGSMAVETNADGSVTAYDLPTCTVRHRLPPAGGVWGAKLHPTAPVIAEWSYGRQPVRLRDLRTGAVQTLIPPWSGGTMGVEWSPDGRSLVCTQGDGTGMVLYDFDPGTLTTATPRPMITPSATGGSGPAFNPAGDRLAVRGWSAHLALFDPATGRNLFTHPSLPSTQTWQRFDPTGRRLAAAARVGDHEDRLGLWSVADGRECRFIPCPVFRSVAEACYPAVSPDGRLVALGADDSLIVLDAHAGREVAAVKFPAIRGSGPPEFDSVGRLITNSMSGCFRWPLARDPADPTRYTLGPPERLPFHPGDRVFGVSHSGEVMAQAMYAGYGMDAYRGGWIRHPDSPTTRRVDPDASMSMAAVSPDGNWVAFAVHATHVRVYDARTGERVWTSPDGMGHCKFSPDGKWLAMEGSGSRCYAVGTWEPGPRLGPGRITSFSPDRTTALLVTAAGVLRLVEAATGRELTRFEDPDLGYVWAAFTPDGGGLVTSAKDGVRVWDLRLIRAQLAEMGLDWDGPPLPPMEPVPPTIHPVKVEVLGKELLDPNAPQRVATLRDAAETVAAFVASLQKGATAADFLRRGQAFAKFGWFDLALRDFDTAGRLDPKATGPRLARLTELSRRGGRWQDVADDADAVLKAEPDNLRVRVRRGWARYELGRFADAAADFADIADQPRLRLTNVAAMRLLQALALDKAGRPDEAASARRQADEVAAKATAPLNKTATMANNYAWEVLLPVRRPDTIPALGVALARESVRLDDTSDLNRNTLGVALYQNGRFRDAIPELERSLKAGKGESDAYDLYPLAACHARLGAADKARDCYRRAEEWVKGKKLSAREQAELADFRAEARRWLPRE